MVSTALRRARTWTTVVLAGAGLATLAVTAELATSHQQALASSRVDDSTTRFAQEAPTTRQGFGQVPPLFGGSGGSGGQARTGGS
jgi:hypothetical protein